MGYNPGLLDQVAGWAGRYGIKPGAAVLDVGAQELFCTDDPKSLNRFLGHFGGELYAGNELKTMANRAFAGDLFCRAGLRYKAVDITPYPRTMRLDLNTDRLPFWHRRRYDLVTNCGTTEHVLNQLNAFRLIHDACKVSGLMYHGVPMGGDYTHGLVAYRPKFFRLLAGNNGYEIVAFWASAGDQPAPFVDGLAGWVPPMPIEFNCPHLVQDAWMHILLRRTSRAPFKAPSDCVE